MVSETVYLLELSWKLIHRLSIDWNCLNNWCRVMYMNWNCWDNCFRRSFINWNYPDNRVLEGSALWKPAATTVYCRVQSFDLVSTLHYHPIVASLNTMEKFPVHPIICKVLLYYALLWVVSIQWGVSYQYAINRYEVMTFLGQLISWAASEFNVRTIPINFQLPKSIVWTIPFNLEPQKSIVWTIPFNRQRPKSIV